MEKITLKAARITAGFSQAKASKCLGITKSTLGSYERMQTIPRADMADRMARLYGFNVNDIIFFN